jgi:hypothetical protein
MPALLQTLFSGLLRIFLNSASRSSSAAMLHPLGAGPAGTTDSHAALSLHPCPYELTEPSCIPHWQRALANRLAKGVRNAVFSLLLLFCFRMQTALARVSDTYGSRDEYCSGGPSALGPGAAAAQLSAMNTSP